MTCGLFIVTAWFFFLPSAENLFADRLREMHSASTCVVLNNNLWLKCAVANLKSAFLCIQKRGCEDMCHSSSTIHSHSCTTTDEHRNPNLLTCWSKQMEGKGLSHIYRNGIYIYICMLNINKAKGKKKKKIGRVSRGRLLSFTVCEGDYEAPWAAEKYKLRVEYVCMCACVCVCTVHEL